MSIKIKDSNKKNTTDFIVMPKDCNYMDIIFGGFFMSQLDLAAATVVNRAIRQSTTADKAVTFKFGVEFAKPSFAGDIITINSEIIEVRKRSITVHQKAYKETREDSARVLVATASTVFVAMNDNHYVNHGLRL